MSYILEALKKAQAERQLGNAPTIHAPAPSYAAPAFSGNRKPLLVGLGAGVLVVAAGAAFLLRQPPAVAPVPVPAPAPVQVAGAPVPVAPAPAPAPAIIVPAPVEPAAEAPAPAETAARARPDVAVPVAAPPRHADPEPPRRDEAVVAIPEPPRAPVLSAAPSAAPASADDSVGPVQSLPEALQRELPKVAFGGYIYSPNPAERLLLVDKMLRREGEEVAPGLVLERLLPKAAIMNFRGYRYRVAY